MWQCGHHFYDELLGPVAAKSRNIPGGREMGKERYFPDGLRDAELDLDLSTPETLRFALEWMNMVNEYRARALSFATDRAVAFAGIASSYQRLYGLTYLAGCWFELLPLSLLWFIEKKPPALIRGQYLAIVPRGVEPVYSLDVEEEGVRDSPSWSWFSAPIWKFWRVSCVYNTDEPSIRSRSLREPTRSNFRDIYWARTLSFRFPHTMSNACPPTGFSAFTNLCITLDTIIFPISQNLHAALASHFHRLQALNPLDANLYWDPDFTYHLDTPSLSSSPSPPRHGIFALLNEFQVVRTAGEYHVQRRMAGLVLVRAEEEGTWMRVGVWRLKVRIGGVGVGEEEGGVQGVAERWGRHELTGNWEKMELVLV